MKIYKIEDDTFQSLFEALKKNEMFELNKYFFSSNEGLRRRFTF